MLNQTATDANKSTAPPLTYPEAPPDSERAKQPPPPGTRYKPYSEKPVVPESPYAPYAKEPALHEPPYEPYKGI